MYGRGEKNVEGFGGKAQRKETTWKTKVWMDGIRMDFRETDWGCGVDSVGSGYGPEAGSCEHGDEPSGIMEFVNITGITCHTGCICMGVHQCAYGCAV
jgi:hypothetical protein